MADGEIPILDPVADVVSGADAISPTIAFIKGMFFGHGVRYIVNADCGWSVNQVVGLLKENGITVWNKELAGDFIQFRVKPEQAKFAEYQLKKNGLAFQKR